MESSTSIETKVNCWCAQQHNYGRMWPHNYGYLKVASRSFAGLTGGEEGLGKPCCMQAIKNCMEVGRPGNDVTLEFVLNKICCTFRVQTAFTSLSDKQKCGKSSFIQRLHIRRVHVIITCRHAQLHTNCIIKRNYKFGYVLRCMYKLHHTSCMCVCMYVLYMYVSTIL